MQLLKYYLISFFSVIHTLIKILRSKYVEGAMSFLREHNLESQEAQGSLKGWILEDMGDSLPCAQRQFMVLKV